MTRRVVVYTRVSTEQQAAEGVSLDAQAARGAKWCDLHGAEHVATMTDAGLSGKNLARPGFEQVWALVQAGEVDTVVVTELSRLTRSARDFANVIADFTERGVSLVAIDNALDTSSAAGRMLAGIMATVAEFEREQTGERIRAALAQVKDEGRHVGRPPVGMTSEGGILRVGDAAGMGLALRCSSMQRAGKTLRDIAATLNAERVPTGSGGGSWHPSSVARLVKAARMAAEFA